MLCQTRNGDRWTQCFDGEKTVVMVDGEKTDDPQANIR